MSFQPIEFTYNPPLTVEQNPLPANTTAPAPIATSQSAVDQAAALSNAGRLLDQLAAQRDVNLYLQQVILALAASQGVALNYNGDPELASALQRLYSSDAPPPGISAAMYANLLETQMGIMRTEMVLQNSNSSLLVSPVQKADLIRATQVYEDAQADAGTFQAHLPLLLRDLKGDQVVIDSLSAGLQKYPVLNGSTYQSADSSATPAVINYVNNPVGANSPIAGLPSMTASIYAIPPNGELPNVEQLEEQRTLQAIDVNPQLAVDLQARTSALGTYYAGMYNVMTATDAVYSDILQITQTYITQPLNKLLMIVSMLSSLKLLWHKPTLGELKASISTLLLPKLVSELGFFGMLMDRMVQRLVNPVLGVLRSMNRLLAEVANSADEVAYLTSQGGFTGLLKGAATGGRVQPPPPERIAMLDKLTDMEGSLGVKLAAGVQHMNQRSTAAQHSLIQSLDRKLQCSGDRLTVLQDLRGIDAAIGIFRSLILQSQGGGGPTSMQSLGAIPIAPVSTAAALSKVVGSLSSGSSSTFSIQAQTLVITPPSVPVATPAVSQTLTAHGANLVTADSITKIDL